MKALVLLGMLCMSMFARAHQPVMDMAPRWAGGYGIQTRVEHFDNETTSWLEGVYTWDRSVRATFKLPYTNGELGNLIVGVPLKKYINDGAKTSNWSITPSLQLPTGEQGEWDTGLSFSYSSETPSFYQLYDLYTWGDRTGLDINFGFSFPTQGRGRLALWDVSILTSKEGDRVQTGPVFVYFKNNWMFRAEYKALAYERDSVWSGDSVSVGIGFVY